MSQLTSILAFFGMLCVLITVAFFIFRHLDEKDHDKHINNSR